IDRRRKLPATTLLLALDSAATEQLRVERAAEGKSLLPFEAQGMSKEEILGFFYDTTTFRRGKKGWMAEFDPTHYRGAKLNTDLVDAKTGKVKAEAGTKLTPRMARKLAEEGL